LERCERERLEVLCRAHSTPQALAFRCRLVLRLAEGDEPTNLAAAEELGCHRNTVEKWRHRYLRDGLQGLQDASRSGRPRSFSPLGAA
jgi:transposase